MPVEDRVGPYRLVSKLGEGGMGVVHRGVDESGRDVAVKLLRSEFTEDESFRLRLQREVETMRRIDSPYVVAVLDADLHGPRPYIVTRYVAGHALDDTVKATGPLSGQLLDKVCTGLAEALVAIHAAGVVHRDLKPNNVMLVGGEPVVIDFGIAHSADSTRLTKTGMIIGTPGYLAPEVVEGERAGPAADVYAWGATVAFAATGRSPFGGGSMEAVIARIIRGQVDLNGMPPELADGVAATLDRDPGRRPNAGQLVGWLRRAGGATVPPVGPPPPTRITSPPMSPPPMSPPMSPPPAAMGMPGRPVTPVPQSPVPFSPAPMSPPPYFTPPPMTPPPGVYVPGRLDLGWYKIIGYLMIVTMAALTSEVPVFFGTLLLAAGFYLRAGDIAVRSRRLPPPTGWRDLMLGPLRYPGALARSVVATAGVLLYTWIAAAIVLDGLLAIPNDKVSNTTALAVALGVAGYWSFAGLGVRAPRRQTVRLLTAVAQDRRTATVVGLISLAVFLLVLAVAWQDVPHTAPFGNFDGKLWELRDKLRSN